MSFYVAVAAGSQAHENLTEPVTAVYYILLKAAAGMVRVPRFSKFLLLLLCTVAFNQGLITQGAHASNTSTVSPNATSSECPPTIPADFSSQEVAPSTSNASLTGHVVQPVNQGQARFIGPLSPTIQLGVELVFKIRNEAQFQNCLASINNPSSPEYRKYLNSTTLQPFLPTPGQKTSVSNLLTQEGLFVTDGASPLVLNIKGNARTIMSAFAVRLSVYSYRNSTFFATGSDPKMPSNFASLVNGILGLDNYTKARPAESPCSGPYCPQGIQIGYSISELITSGVAGSGQKVAVVDMPGDPHSQTAINTFDAQYGLTATTLDIVYPDGNPTSWDPLWASEAAMDIEAVHSVAPGATIVLAYDTADPMNGVDYVTSHGLASVISNSWTYDCGFACTDMQLPSSEVSSYDSRLATDAAQGVTILFASGDNGWKPDGSTIGTQFPASDPNVLAVGATNLVLTGCGTTTCMGYGSESGSSISGGGYSGYFSEPSWQTSAIGSTESKCTAGRLHSTCRGVPDVGMLGYVPGFWVYSTASDHCGTTGTSAGWFECTGTSLSTPLWAGFIGVALQLKGGGQFGIIAPLLYSLGAGSSYSTLFHDVTTGSNGYSAATGWDPVTGWGSPIATTLASALSGASLQTLTTNVGSGSKTGSVSPNCPSGCSEIANSEISISATPAAGYAFSNWIVTGASCSGASTNNPCTFTMPNHAVTVSATFTSNTVTMSVSYSVVGGGSPSPPVFHYILKGVSKRLVLTTAATNVETDRGSAWSVTPNPLHGSSSSEQWYSTQPLTGTASAIPIQFIFQHQYRLTILIKGSGSAMPSSGWYNAGQKVTITATADPGHQFNSWAGSGTGSYTGKSPSHMITMGSTITEIAKFT